MAEEPASNTHTNVKKNPLKNNATLYRLNPYAKTLKRKAQLQQDKLLKTKQSASKTKETN